MGRRSEETRVSELPHGSYCLFRVSWSLGLVFVWGDVSEKDLVKGGAPQTQAGAGAEEEPVLYRGDCSQGGRAHPACLRCWEGGGPSGMTEPLAGSSPSPLPVLYLHPAGGFPKSERRSRLTS